MEAIVDDLVKRYPVLDVCTEDILKAYRVMENCYTNDGIVYLCGNGGSAADAGHIVGELMKSFSLSRPLSPAEVDEIGDLSISSSLEGALRAVSLSAHSSLSTAFANDVASDLVFAQQVFGYGRKGDVLWALSTSGNANNVLLALRVARARGLATMGLTGQSGGAMAPLCDACIRVPESDTDKVQELHLPVYHALCRMLEEHFFGNP
jgi:D-sedoheptulose 7-phosphate isomerase